MRIPLFFAMSAVALAVVMPGYCKVKSDSFGQYLVVRDMSSDGWRLRSIDLETGTVRMQAMDFVPLGPLCFQAGVLALHSSGRFVSYDYEMKKQTAGQFDPKGVIAFVHKMSEDGRIVAVVSDPKDGEVLIWLSYLRWQGNNLVEERRVRAPFFGTIVSSGKRLWLVNDTDSFQLPTE